MKRKYAKLLVFTVTLLTSLAGFSLQLFAKNCYCASTTSPYGAEYIVFAMECDEDCQPQV